MVKCHHEVILNTDNLNVWKFMEDWSNWAEMVPGYRDHEIISAQESIWKIHGELGSMKKDTHIRVHITEIKAPTFIGFSVNGLKEQCVGNGSFQVNSDNHHSTILTGNMEITIKGWIGTVLYPLIKQMLPKVLEDFMEQIPTKLEASTKNQQPMRVNISL